MDATSFAIDMRDQKGLAGRVAIRKAASEKLARGPKTVELEREFDTLIPHVLVATGALDPPPLEADRLCTKRYPQWRLIAGLDA